LQKKLFKGGFVVERAKTLNVDEALSERLEAFT